MKRAILLASLLAATAAFAAVEKPRRTSFLTRDGKSLAAVYRKPAAGNPVAVMLHGLSSAKEEWTPLADRLAKAGWGSLAYDARGHGASDKSGRGVRSLGVPGPQSQWDRMPDDLGAAVRFVETQMGVARSSIVVIGASLGANVAIRYSAESAPLRDVVLLSPGLNYMEFRPEGDIVRGKSPTLIVASVEDKYAFSSSLRLKNLAPADELWTDVPPGHGVQMITPAFADRLLQWLERDDR